MKVAMLEVSHWHAELIRPGVEAAGAAIVAVSDASLAATAPWVERFGCSAYADWRQLLDKERPDFAFAFGIHRAMPAIAAALVEKRIPFSLEKPGGLKAADVAAVRKAQEKAGLFASVHLVNRVSPLVALLRERLASGALGPIAHMTFSDLAGSPDRYPRAGCGWMLDPQAAGGGCLINLSVHFVDLFRHLAGVEAPRVTGAVVSSRVHGRAVEDMARVLMDDGAGGRSCFMEVGYVHPDDAQRHQEYAIVGAGWLAEIAEGRCRIVSNGREEVLALPIVASPFYATYAQETLARAARGRAPLAGLADLEAVMRVIDAAYAAAGR
ncbi:MAG: Gfo/Idh/MocA family oxidoreductase [Alphaproteobacteria bacterium]|nr:Gfo/Idh/MocA family oxidoreductase [Alphaproteobacteria bacterium]